jgi:hypothetical protein
MHQLVILQVPGPDLQHSPAPQPPPARHNVYQYVACLAEHVDLNSSKGKTLHHQLAMAESKGQQNTGYFQRRHLPHQLPHEIWRTPCWAAVGTPTIPVSVVPQHVTSPSSPHRAHEW